MPKEQSNQYLRLSTPELEEKLRSGKLSAEDGQTVQAELTKRYTEELVGAQDGKNPEKPLVQPDNPNTAPSQKLKSENAAGPNISSKKKNATVSPTQAENKQKSKSGVWGVIAVLIIVGVIIAVINSMGSGNGDSGGSGYTPEYGSYCQINDGRGTCELVYQTLAGSPCSCTDGVFAYPGTAR